MVLVWLPILISKAFTAVRYFLFLYSVFSFFNISVSEVYPNISHDEAGMCRLFKQFSFPGGVPSHVAAETPGSIHEGGATKATRRHKLNRARWLVTLFRGAGELGYALSHAFGAAFDNPSD